MEPPGASETVAPRILALFGARVIFGQERANIAALTALRREGCRILCVIRPETWPELIELRKTLDSYGLAWTTARYIDYPIQGWRLKSVLRNPGAYLSGNAALKRIARDYDATHIHAFNPWYVAAFWSALRALKQPMIYRTGDRPILHNMVYRSVWRFIRKRAARFVADSEYIRGELVASGVDPARIVVLQPPPPERLATDRDPQVDLSPGKFRFVYVGQINQAKGVDILIEAFRSLAAKFPDTELCIAGKIGEWEGDAWARRLRDSVLKDPALGRRIRFLGWIKDPAALLARCDVHVAPSIVYESYGLVVVEAKSAGRPSIIFDSGGISELVSDGIDGFIVHERTAGALATAMETYLSESMKAAEHGAAAKASLARFGFDRFDGAWRKIYDAASKSV